MTTTTTNRRTHRLDGLVDTIRQEREPDLPDTTKVTFRGHDAEKQATSTKGSATHQSKTSSKWYTNWFWEIDRDGADYMTEMDSYQIPDNAVEDAIETTLRGNVAVITNGDEVTSPQLSTTITKRPVKRPFNQLGKMHAVYVSGDGDSFMLHLLTNVEQLAEMYADKCEPKLDANHAIVTAFRSKDEVQNSMTRAQLDVNGHHYAVLP